MSAMSMMQKPLEILIVGTGAVGTIFGARAQNARSKVTAVCRGNYDVAKSRGIGIKSALWGASLFVPDRVVRCPAEVSHVDFDYIVLATKLSNLSNDPLIESLRPAIRPRTTLVSVQNGVTSEIALRQSFDNTIFSSTCYISCAQKQPGIVEQVANVRPHAFYIGINKAGRFSDGKRELDTLVGLDDAFAKVEDAQVERWRKMVFNTAWSLSTSLMDKNTHGVLRDTTGAQLVLGLAQEAHRVARSLGVELDPDLPRTTVESARHAPPIVPSMLQDIRRKKPIEVEALCGGILRIAQQQGIPTPLLDSMYRYLSNLNRSLEARQSMIVSIPKMHAPFTIPATRMEPVHAMA